MAFIYDLTDTWNAGGTTFNAIKMNVTDTASAAASKLVTLQVGGSERFGVRKDGQGYFAGNVGIGTSSPFGKLHLQDTVANLEMFMLGPVVGSARIRFGDTDDSNIGQIIYDNTSDSMQFHANNAERMRIDSSGNVGIGTSSPGALLDVSQGANATVIGRVLNANAGASADARLLVSNGTTQSGMIMRGTGHASANHLALFQNSTTAPMTFLTNGAERMRIDSSGQLGIGTTSPFNRLSVLGANEFSLGFSARTSSTQTPLLNHPVVVLENSSNAAGNGLGLRYQIADTGGTLRLAGGVGMVATAKDASSVTADMYFYTGTSERMRITNAGNVGIGTTSPNAAARLDVSSTTSGFLPPRMTTAQRDAITSPPDGLMLYNTTTNKLQVRAASAWVDLH